jgi:hypothetical protein
MIHKVTDTAFLSIFRAVHGAEGIARPNVPLVFSIVTLVVTTRVLWSPVTPAVPTIIRASNGKITQPPTHDTHYQRQDGPLLPLYHVILSFNLVSYRAVPQIMHNTQAFSCGRGPGPLHRGDRGSSAAAVCYESALSFIPPISHRNGRNNQGMDLTRIASFWLSS